MKITVPFIYEAIILKPRCRKPVGVAVRDSVEVEIEEVSADALPVAFRIGQSELRYDGERLWDYDYMTAHRETPRTVTAAEVLKNTLAPEAYMYSGPTAEAPFKNFWQNLPTEQLVGLRHNLKWSARHTTLSDARAVRLDEVVAREWLDSNRDEVAELARSIAAGCRIFNGVMMQPAGEPRYVVQTFGLGNNHGGTGMFVSQSYNSNIGAHSYFTALQRADAAAYANAVAERRGDLKSMPVEAECDVIEVLMPEAVKLNPAADHGDGSAFINKIERGIQEAGPVGGLAAMASALAMD